MMQTEGKIIFGRTIDIYFLFCMLFIELCKLVKISEMEIKKKKKNPVMVLDQTGRK